MSPRELVALRPLLTAWNHRQDRAREEYLTHPVSHEVAVDDQCDDLWCSDKARGRSGKCEYHYRRALREKKKQGALA